MESWVPRRPSPGLKERIFNGASAEAQRGPNSSVFSFARHERPTLPGWVKFAPVCCIVLLTMVLNMNHQEKSAYFAVATGSNALASLSSNLLVLCSTDTREQRQNVWKMTFDWTKDAHSLSTMGSFPAANTNKL